MLPGLPEMIPALYSVSAAAIADYVFRRPRDSFGVVFSTRHGRVRRELRRACAGEQTVNITSS
jgi:hypothetical protein